MDVEKRAEVLACILNEAKEDPEFREWLRVELELFTSLACFSELR